MLFTDHLGSVRMAGYTTHDYEPFGREMTPTLDYTTHMFTGHERDAETGLDYMLARYYQSRLCRFVAPDPLANAAALADPQKWNRFAYANNNPIRLVDPSGKAVVPYDADPEAIAVFNRSVEIALLSGIRFQTPASEYRKTTNPDWPDNCDSGRGACAVGHTAFILWDHSYMKKILSGAAAGNQFDQLEVAFIHWHENLHVAGLLGNDMAGRGAVEADKYELSYWKQTLDLNPELTDATKKVIQQRIAGLERRVIDEGSRQGTPVLGTGTKRIGPTAEISTRVGPSEPAPGQSMTIIVGGVRKD
jgi:RHS repeat-associated protein